MQPLSQAEYRALRTLVYKTIRSLLSESTDNVAIDEFLVMLISFLRTRCAWCGRNVADRRGCATCGRLQPWVHN